MFAKIRKPKLKDLKPTLIISKITDANTNGSIETSMVSIKFGFVEKVPAKISINLREIADKIKVFTTSAIPVASITLKLKLSPKIRYVAKNIEITFIKIVIGN